jgi:hypothetical protein
LATPRHDWQAGRMKRTFHVQIEHATKYISLLLGAGMEFHVKPFTNRVDVSLETDSPDLFCNPRWLVKG